MVTVEAYEDEDGAIVLIPKIHHMVLDIMLTAEGTLGSIAMEVSCAGHLGDLLKERSLHLKAAGRPLPQVWHFEVNASGKAMTGATSSLPTWDQQKKLAFLSIVEAADEYFQEGCSSGMKGEVEIPGFDLADPEIVTMLTVGQERGVLPIGFEVRRHAADRYVAFKTSNWSEDPRWVGYVGRVLKTHEAARIALICRRQRRDRQE
jgi:hypothetical protein